MKAETSLGIDFQGVGTSFHVARELNYKGNVFFGGEIGFLPNFLSFTILADRNFTQKHTIWSKDRRQEDDNSNMLQLIFLHAFTRWQPTEAFELDAGIRFSQFIDGGPIMEDSFGYPKFIGFYAKPLIGFEELKIGGRFDFGYMSASDSRNANEFVIIVSPLIRFKFRFSAF
ncbi:MAG: hypothetical protein ACJAVF_002662 [Paraglaciecola sp.]|jgi:hypothetical protein